MSPKKFYLDTEFIERPDTIKLVSIGIVDENGKEFYAEMLNIDNMLKHLYGDVSMVDPWIKENVIDKLWQNEITPAIYPPTDKMTIFLESGGQGGYFRDKRKLALAILDFIGDLEPEFWAYFADYDWVVFCWIFGRMIDLPRGFPMYCNDIKQLHYSMGNHKCMLPPQPADEHNALADARWNKLAHSNLTNYI